LLFGDTQQPPLGIPFAGVASLCAMILPFAPFDFL
jgi:hypothetical protein